MKKHSEISKHFIETVLIRRDGSIPLLKEHYKRYRHTVRSSGLLPTFSLQGFKNLVRSSLNPESLETEGHTWRCRIVYRADGTVSQISAQRFELRKLYRVGRIELPEIRYHLKFADRTAFKQLFECFPSYDEIIILQRGFLSDGSFTNLYLRKNEGDLLTPSHSLLQGCRRSRLLIEGKLRVQALRWDELQPDWKIGFINAMNPLGQLGEFAVSEITELTKP